jgi:hypothetical protein
LIQSHSSNKHWSSGFQVASATTVTSGSPDSNHCPVNLAGESTYKVWEAMVIAGVPSMLAQELG